ncbi:diphthamide biosynthesis protein 2 [Radiomyces spectabilis]|uniref:diphthamide biosynthesis protein 2 n=1 Tax=Radiomyces spectabilis TaxID=64574 RepID=UPI00221F38EC|nr:diphthamide biosynthesis protein 2 [Radiomyces spectabilis]KAI8365398.1 diphthamide biosynthesis protein 2 [Radiomyces spectabilis]
MAAPSSGPTTFADDGQAVIERTIDVESVKHTDLEALYEIDRTVTGILQGDYKRVALQFPDELLADAAAVSAILRERTGKEIFILADTSYGSCCVDEVAAEHVNSDLIVHYGRSCLSPPSRLPVLYVFGQKPMNLDHCMQEFESLFPDPAVPVIIMCDVEYSYAVESLTSKLKERYSNIIPTKIQTSSKLQTTLDKTEQRPLLRSSKSCGGEGCGRSCSHDLESLEEDHGHCGGHAPKPSLYADVNDLADEKKKGGRYFELPEGVSIEDCSIFFIGVESLTLTNIIMVHNKCPVYTYDPKTKVARKETIQVNRMLMKRYFLVQKAKDANTIGIVVGTLGVASYMNIIEHLKKLIKNSGRKSYFFVMGKLNVAKMANFMEIDCYVLVACPENSLIDSKEFYRPIVTPFELEIALVRSKEWTGDYVLDFSKLLPQLRTDGFVYDEEREEGSSDEEEHFSLITGQYKPRLFQRTSTKKADDTGEVLTSKLTDLTLRNNERAIATLLHSTAGEYLRNRTYKGLEQRLGEDEAGEVLEGRSGIARGYKDEKQ